MTKKKSTKSALISSILSLFLCFAMLLGSTFAWFTDSVTSADNIIKSGTLDVELYYAKGNEAVPADDSSDWKNAHGIAVYDYDKWEPGYTDAKHIKISNEGTLALKYQLAIIPTGEVSKLADVIDVYLYEIADTDLNATQVEDRTKLDANMRVGTLAEVISRGIVQGTLAANADYTTTIVLKMRDEAGNEYQNLSIGDAFTIQLLATQLASEDDSFGNDYDKDAWVEGMLVYTAEDLQAAITAGENAKMMNSIELTETLVIPAAAATMSLRSTPVATVIDLNGNTISGSMHKNEGAIIKNEGFLVLKNGTISSLGNNGGSALVNAGTAVLENVTLNGAPNADGSWPSYTLNNTGVLEATNVKFTSYHGSIASYNEGALVTLNNCEIDMKGIPGFTNHGIYTYSNGAVVINGGTYVNHAADQVSTGGSVINGAVTVNGGTFSGRVENYYGTPVINGGAFSVQPNAKFITNGYKSEKIDGNWVISAAIKSVEDLQEAIDNAKNGETIFFVQDITSTDGVLISDKNLTIDLGGHTYTVSEGASVSNRNIKITGSSTVTVKNGTLIANGNTESGAFGTIRTEGTANVTLEDLNLYNYRGGGLNVKAVSGTTVTINNCEIYSQYGGGVEASGGTIVLNDTKIEQKGVYGNGWYSVAMEINSSGKITVNSGEYFGSAIATDENAAGGNCVAFILSSGGTLDIYGGTFNGIVAENAAAANFCGLIYADRAAVVNIYGGTFNSNGAILDMRNNAGSQPNPTATISGGTFSADPRISGLYASNLITIAEGYKLVTLNGAYAVMGENVVANTDELVAAINAGKTEIELLPGDYALRFTNNVNFNVNNMTLKGLGDVKLAITSSEAWYGRIQGSNVTFENIHFTSSVGATGKATYNNCIFDSWAICASSNQEQTYFNDCTINGCLNTSTDFNSGDAFAKNCKIAKAEYSGSMTMNFEDCQIGEMIIWNSNTNLTNCDVTTLDLSNVTTAKIIKDGAEIR